MPSTECLPPKERGILLALARRSIQSGLDPGSRLDIRIEDYPESLHEKRACFVTLNKRGALRGCIGHLEAVQPLVMDVVENAHAAAFRDPRFPPLQSAEMDALDIHISVLTPASPLPFTSEKDLVDRLRPGIDGLILQSGSRRGTFLPSVWESLPEPREFLRHLKLKAGMTADSWSDDTRVYRYTTESFSTD
jgi:AmmeMemoRadiSam system protein A